jgi:enoyl-CoA hydratase
MSYKQILFEPAEDGICLLTLNRPQKLNALNADTVGELDDAFAKVENSPDYRALILTGSGEKAFVAGADINELAANDAVQAHRMSQKGQGVLRRLETMGKPSIAAINGFALGGGLELAMACTLRIASPNARLGQPEVKLGIVPGYGGTQRLPRLIGRGRALEMLLTGDPIDAAEAHRIGLVNHIVEQPELVSFARTLLKKMLANAPVALALTIQAVDAGLNMSLEDGLRFEAAAFGVSAATEDRREGPKAFLEKRAATVTGRSTNRCQVLRKDNSTQRACVSQLLWPDSIAS